MIAVLDSGRIGAPAAPTCGTFREPAWSSRSSAAGVLGAFAALAVSNQLFDRYLTLGLALLISGASLAPSAVARSLTVASAPTPSVGVARTTR